MFSLSPIRKWLIMRQMSKRDTLGGKVRPMAYALMLGAGGVYWGWRHIRERRMVDAEVRRLREALTSIANNSCCPPCREAGLVAKRALNPTPPQGQPDDTLGV